MSAVALRWSLVWRAGALAIALWIFVGLGIPFLHAALNDAVDAMQFEEAER